MVEIKEYVGHTPKQEGDTKKKKEQAKKDKKTVKDTNPKKQ